MFFPGETITHQFIIPFQKSEIAKVILTYEQNDQVVLEETITSGFEEIELQKTKFDFVFSQPESLAFQDDSDYSIQLNVYTKGGTRHVSHLLHGYNGVQYLREVIT